MIPTVAPNSSPALASTAAVALGVGGTAAASAVINNHSLMNSQQNAQAATIGIASLILEGRALSFEDYAPAAATTTATATAAAAVAAAASISFLFGSSLNAAENNGSGSGGGGGGASSCLPAYCPSPPRASTSRAASSGNAVGSSSIAHVSPHVINITTNPTFYGWKMASSGSSGSSSAASSAESTHQRWTQKLCQLRQSSPAASHLHTTTAFEQKIAIEAQGTAVEPELVSLAIHDVSNRGQRGDFEIMQRVLLHRSSGAQPTTDHVLHSLQSLASTRLRGSGANGTAAIVGNSRQQLQQQQQQQQQLQQHELFTPQLSGNASRWQSPGSASSSGSGVQSPGNYWTTSPTSATTATATARDLAKAQLYRCATATSTAAAAAATTAAAAAKMPTKTYSKQGPHCEQFLRQMGIAKSDCADAEEHICDMSYVNITCSLWQNHCQKIKTIVERGDTVCIEVYLGPVSHKILLEQWIITHKEKMPPPTMSLPSLCSAIRSQLYFSQISAWCDLIRKSDSIYDTGRVVFPTPNSVAGDLATNVNSLGTAAAAATGNCSVSVTAAAGTTAAIASTITANSNLDQQKRQQARLNIFYRVIKFDSTASFTSKPNIHNFPNVNISENCCVSVCLKSLPRINGGIPKIGAVNTMPIVTAAARGGATVARKKSHEMETPKTSRQPHCLAMSTVVTAAVTTTTTTTPTMTTTVCDSKKCSNNNNNHNNSNSSSHSNSNGNVNDNNATANLPKAAATFFIDEDELLFADELDAGDDDDASDTNVNKTGYADMSHRERQLQKYRKRMQKRDKQRHKKTDSNAQQQPMEECVEQETSQQSKQTSANSSSNCFVSNKRANSQQIEMISTGTQTISNCCQQCGAEKAQICLQCNSDMLSHTRAIATTTTTTPTDADELDESSSISSSDMITTPRNEGERLLQSIQRTPKMAKLKKKAMAMRNADNTVSVKTSTSNTAVAAAAAVTASTTVNNNHVNGNAMPMAAGAVIVGCQVCKRQKTQHDFTVNARVQQQQQQPQTQNELKQCSKMLTLTNEATLNVDKQHVAIDVVDNATVHAAAMNLVECAEINRENSTPNIDNALPSGKILQEEIFLTHTNIYNIKKLANTAMDHSIIANKRVMRSSTPPNNSHAPTQTQFRTPTTMSNVSQHRHTPKPLLLHIANNYEENSKTTGNCNMRKLLPKVNLTPIFCNSSSCISSPIPIVTTHNAAVMEPSFNFDAALLHAQQQHTNTANTNNNNIVDNTGIPVQKSFSAPTLPNSPSPSLSPRFAKQAAIYKRRSRHLSDRSDRSSLGSDEQFSDEEIDFTNMTSPAQSPIKSQSLLNAPHRRRPLLGNLEESLLQNRLKPKTEFYGFKVMLGASGSFCPKQLTLPAMAYFYELHGETLSTPYVCDIRLPRKGYSVPRIGKVQATLLNPMGTVVRIFVIPYDMQDMPPLHQTFIRQRILADANDDTLRVEKQQHWQSNNIEMNGNESAYAKYGGGDGASTVVNDGGKFKLSPNGGLHGEGNLGHFISAEHIKRLRYSIHLRFQTSRSGRLSLHTDIRLLISRRTDCDTAAAHAKGVLEAPNDLITDTVMPYNPKYSASGGSSTGASRSGAGNYCSNNNGNAHSGSKI